MQLAKLSADSCVFPAIAYFAGRIECGARVWVAEWSPAPGIVKRARFSVRKFGEAGAKEMALNKRFAMAKELSKEDDE